MNPFLFMPTPLSSIPVSSRYFVSEYGYVLWEITQDGLVFPINIATKHKGPQSKLEPADVLESEYLEELTPEAASEMLEVALEHDATGAYAASIYDSVLTPAYVPVHGRVVTMCVMADRFFNDAFELRQNHFFSMS